MIEYFDNGKAGEPKQNEKINLIAYYVCVPIMIPVYIMKYPMTLPRKVQMVIK